MWITLVVKETGEEFDIRPDSVAMLKAEQKDTTTVVLWDGSDVEVVGSRDEVRAKLKGVDPAGPQRRVEKIDGELTLGDRVKDVEERVKILMEQRAIHGTTLNEHHSRIGDLEELGRRLQCELPNV